MGGFLFQNPPQTNFTKIKGVSYASLSDFAETQIQKKTKEI
jgi:hypothetical protein